MTTWSQQLRLLGHKDSINALQFSADGQYLASGGDDGRLLLFSTSSGRQIQKVFCAAPVTALCWSKIPATQLYVALADGRVLSAQLVEDTISSHYLPRGSDDGHVEDLIHDELSRCLVVCAGPNVELWRDVQPFVMAKTVIPSPLDTQEQGTHLAVRSVHIADRGVSLIISYLNHGIHCWDMIHHKFHWAIQPRRSRIGRSALSPDSQLIAVSNLSDGFDLYRTADQTHIRTFVADMHVRVTLPVMFVDNGSTLVMGSSCGRVTICDVKTGDRIQELDHGSNGIVQAMAGWGKDSQAVLATGPSERGDQTVVYIWRASTRVYPAQRNVSRQMLEDALSDSRLPTEPPKQTVNETSKGEGRGILRYTMLTLVVTSCTVIIGIAWIMMKTPAGQRLSLSGLSADLVITGASDSIWGGCSWSHVKNSFFKMTVTVARRMRQMLTRYIVYMN